MFALEIIKKIKRDKLVKQGFHELKLRHCDLMIEFNTHEKNVAISKGLLSRFNTPSIQEDEAAWTKALERVVLYIALAPQDEEQRRMIEEVYSEKKLANLVDFKWVLEKMRTPEVCLEFLTKNPASCNTTYLPGQNGVERRPVWSEGRRTGNFCDAGSWK